MQRLLIILMSVVILFGACKEVETVRLFEETPEARIGQILGELQHKLLEAEHGWKASLTTSAKGGYSFFMEFSENQEVEMIADLTAATASEAETSTYRVKWAQGATLIFDTYNYIAMLQDPNPGVYGGSSGSGLQSDVEFELDRMTADSLILKGVKYRNELVMVKANGEEKTHYRNGGLAGTIGSYQAFFADHDNNYITIADGGESYTMAIKYNHDNKSFAYEVLEPDESVSSAAAKFYYTLEGVGIATDLIYRGISLSNMMIKADGKLYIYDGGGEEYEVLQSPTPLTPLKSLFNYNGTYNMLYIDGDMLPPGVVSGFNDVYNATTGAITASGRSTRFLQFELLNSSSLMVTYAYAAGTTNYIATATFDYVREDDRIKLTDRMAGISYSGNWNTRRSQLIRLEEYLVGAEFRIDWVVSSDPNVTGLGGLYRVEDESDFFYGELR